VKIYEHPLDTSVTVVEIETNDEKKSYLEPVISGFDEHGSTYPSASYGESGKKVIYLDGRLRKLLTVDDNEILCMLTAQLGTIESDSILNPMKKSIALAETAGYEELIARLELQPPEYFNAFKTLKI
jgi:hypothetical protein